MDKNVSAGDESTPHIHGTVAGRVGGGKAFELSDSVWRLSEVVGSVVLFEDCQVAEEHGCYACFLCILCSAFTLLSEVWLYAYVLTLSP